MEQNKKEALFTPEFIKILVMALAFFLSIMFLTSGIPGHITATSGDAFIGGLMTTVFMVAAILTRPVIGYIIQKANLNALNIVTVLSLALLIFALSLTEHTAVMLVLRVLQGICFGILSTSIATMATSSMPKSRMGEGIGYYGMATSGGTSFAPMLALAILQSFSYRALILTSTALALVTFVLLLSTRTKDTEKRDTKPLDDVEKLSFLDYAFDKDAVLPCAIVAFFSFTLGGVTSFLRPLSIEAEIESTVSLFFLVQAIVLLISKAVSGIVYDRYGHKMILYPAAISGILGLFLLSRVETTFVLLIAAVFYGIAYGFLTTTLQTLAVSRVEKHKQGTANAMFLSFMDLGMALGSPILGLVAGALSYHGIYAVSIIFILALVVVYTVTIGKEEKLHEKSRA